MRNNARSPFTSSMGRFGFLFADLFAVLAMIFLLANTMGHYVAPKHMGPTPTLTPTPAPIICGLESKATFDNTNGFPVVSALADPTLGASYTAAVKSFQTTVHDAFLPYYQSQKSAGFVLVWGLAPDVGTGDTLAADAEVALRNLAAQKFVFTRAEYQPLWDGSHYNANVGDAVRLEVFFYNTSVNGKACA